MNARRHTSNLWAWIVPGVLLVGCPATTRVPNPPPDGSADASDGGADVTADGASDGATGDVAGDARSDARSDGGADAKVDGGDDVVQKDVADGGDDGGADAGDDASADVMGSDITPVDVPGTDVPGTDVPGTDVPGTDVPGTDAATGCPFPTQRALVLPSDRVMATLSGMSRINMACTAVGGPDHIYPLRVTTRTGVLLSTESMIDTVLSVRRMCDSAMSELACNDDIPGATTSLVRRVLDPGDYFVIVDQYGMGGMGGAYTLNVATYTPAANAECAAGTALTAGAAVMGDTRGGGAASTACLNDQWGPQLFYTLTIPPGQRATVTATPMGMPAWRAVVRAQPSCTMNTCVASGTSATAGAAATETIDNRGSAPLNVAVSVASTTASTGGAFSLTAAFSPVPAAATNADCAMATPVADGAVLTGENPGLGTTRLNGACVAGAQGTTLFYRTSVPSRATLVFTATPMGMWDPVIRVLDRCGATSCLGSSNAAGAGTAETLRWTNVAAAAQDVWVAVGSNDAGTTGTFNGRVQIVPPPTNTTCASALAVTSGVALTAQNAAAGTENLTGPCLPSATGTVLYYRVSVPAGNQLFARVTPAAGVDPVVRLLDACGASTCLGNTNAAGASGAESLTYTNSTTGDRTYILAVGGNTNATNGLFDLAVDVRREYTESSVARACDDMTGGTAVMGVNGDDTVSGILDLPFTFTFYGERELEYAVSSNGLVQLFPTLMGTTSNSYNNVAIPTAAAPNGFIAAFWDDLFPVMGSTVTTRVFDTAPNRRFVIQWQDFAFYGDDRARITMQAKLFEGSNAIELHYCTLTAGMMADRITGASATVGIESSTGTAGRQHSLDTAMSVNTTRGIRFTP